ncbi:hypothetical protein GCM10022419_013390 [Nonomuraea rosea]|uniref:OmpR/PhoB-type domain-containing protein n=2 Tax=Nonomuraea rosea TaxID=638574 RepID=A0ABP6VG01_9ACTN
MLGPLDVTGSGKKITIGAAKQQAILAVLLLRPAQVVTIDHLMAELWGEESPATAKTSLQTYVYRLRRALAPLEVCLETCGAGYRLTVPDEAVDLRVFESSVAEVSSALAQGRFPAAAGRLRDALSMWRGPLLAGVETESVRLERQRLDEVRLNAQELCLEAELGLGLHCQALPDLRRLVDAHPFRESLWAKLMTALAASGRRAEALAAYRRVHGILTAELGIEPDGDLRRLHERILCGSRM